MIIRPRSGHAFARATRRWSPWRIVLVPLGLACVIGMFVVINNFAFDDLILLGPDHAFFCTPTHFAAFVLVILGFVVSVPIGLVIANLLLWMVPPIRYSLENAESRAGGSFVRNLSQLVTLALPMYLVVVPLYLIALSSSVCLSDGEIYYRPNIFFPLRTYDLSQVVEVRSRCTRGREGWDIGIEITMTDGSLFDLAVAEGQYRASSERILGLFHNIRLKTAQISPDCPNNLKKSITP